MNDPATPLLQLAREHLARRDLPAAETLLREVLRHHPDVAEAHHLLGVVLHGRDDLATARESFQRALALDPGCTEAALHLAITCNELGLYTEAARVSGAAALTGRGDERLSPYVRARLADKHADVARAYEQLSLFGEAAHEYRRALALCPDNAELHTRLGVVLRSGGDVTGACTELEAAAARAPEYAPAHVALGLTYYRLGRRGDAERAWRRALVIDPTQRPAEVYLHMLDEEPGHMPSLVPPQPTRDDELGELVVSVLPDREATA